MGVGGQLHAPAALPPGNRPGTHCIGGWVGPRSRLDGCEKSRPLHKVVFSILQEYCLLNTSPELPHVEQRVSSCRSVLNFSLGRAPFEFQPGHQLPGMSSFVGFLIPSRQLPGHYVQTDRHAFLSHALI
jgi:hypothetical protein